MKIRFYKKLVAIVVALLSLAGGLQAQPIAQREKPQFANDRVLVKLANTPAMRSTTAVPGVAYSAPNLGVTYSGIRLLNPSKGNAIRNSFSTMNANDKQNNVYVLMLEEEGEQTVKRALEILSANPAIEIAEPAFYYQLYATPNDPMFSQQYALQKINAPAAWNITTGSKNVVVGIIDSGIDGTHPDLAGNLWVNPNPNQDGFVNDINGYDFVNAKGGIPTDAGNHGTHVSGIVGAKGNNGIGVSGINWNVSLAWLGAGLDGGQYISIEAVIEALNYANNHNIQITNNSYGGPGYSAIFEDAIRNYKGLFVASAGNEMSNNDLSPKYPACYNLPNVISVASTDQYDNLSWFSNYGANSVHIAAPGSDILSTVPNGRYEAFSGTSMASPYVAGAAALLLSTNSSLTPAQLKNVLIDSADPITISTPIGWQSAVRLNAHKALNQAELQPLNLTHTASGQNVTLNWQAPLNTMGLQGYRIYRDGTLLTPSAISALTYTDVNAPNGIYTYTVTSVYSNGGTASVSTSVTAGYVISITAHPAVGIHVIEGNISGNLSVAAKVSQDIPLSYQWYSNTTYSNVGGSPISDATSSTFNIPTTLSAGLYYYFCEVNATGAASVCSNVTTVGVAGIGDISFLDENGNIQNVSATTLTGTETSLTTGWYFVPNNITYPGRLTISTPDHGGVVIILGDNTHMNASKGGINVGEGHSLRIYAQSNGANMGRLTATGGDNQAGIGGDVASTGGIINIVGGNITATGGGTPAGGAAHGGAGIGGGGANEFPSSGGGGNISISGGIITATGDWGGSGIGCGGGAWYDRNGTITIKGGTITATGGTFDGYGIAGGIINTISGNAVLISSSINQENSILPALPATENIGPAIIYNNGMGTMYGNVTLARNVTIPQNSNLFINCNQTLTIQSGYSLTNNGTIIVEECGTITGTVTGNQPTAPVFTISGGSDYTYTKGVLTITGDGTYSIGMRPGITETTAERIVVEQSVNADITLSNVNINMSNNIGLSSLNMTKATVNLTLIGANRLIAGRNRAGLEAPFGSTLVVTKASIGSLLATGGAYAAGIGGRGAGWTPGIATCGNISIAGGTITATGGFAGAGIGNGQGGINSTIINISGGTIIATGSEDAAGIGGGQADISDITINISGGMVTATGSSYAAGIGGTSGLGWYGELVVQGATVNITGGIVNAKRGSYGGAYDIGSGGDTSEEFIISDTNISITGGSVFAANKLITNRWSDGITRYPVKATVLNSNNNKTNNAMVTHNDYTNPAITGGNYTGASFTTFDQGVAWLWLPAGVQSISASNGTHSGSNTVNVSVSGGNNDVTIALTTTGIDDVVANRLQIFPNPAKEDIFIKSELPVEKVEIYSLTGNLLSSENNFKEKISVSDLSRGVYLLKVYTDKGIIISKIIKN
jgi:subtilisin family serine protease